MEVRGLVKHFPITRGIVIQRKIGAVQAVDGVSFDVQRGETLGIVGETGCGKSTTARLIMRLLEARPRAKVHFRRASDITHLKGARDLRPVRSIMQMVFQDPYSSLNPRKTIGSIIGQPFAIHGLGRGAVPAQAAAVQRLMQAVKLDAHYYDRYPPEFTGGEKQRVGHGARAFGALAGRADRRRAGVGARRVSIQAQVLNLLRDMQRQLGLTLIFIAHDLSVVRHMCDRVAVMYLGRIVEIGPGDQPVRLPPPPLHGRAAVGRAGGRSDGAQGRADAAERRRAEPRQPAERMPLAVPRRAAAPHSDRT